MKITVSNICSAFNEKTVGSKVVSRTYFMACLEEAIGKAKFDNGMCVVPVNDATVAVASGVAKRSTVPFNGYVGREHRGEVILCAMRVYASETKSVSVVVYTAARYHKESQVSHDEAQRVVASGAQYVIVAVLASAGEGPSPLTSHRFTRNLAGGNKDYSPENGYTLEKAIQQAKEITAYEQEWIVVAD